MRQLQAINPCSDWFLRSAESINFEFKAVFLDPPLNEGRVNFSYRGVIWPNIW